MRKFAFVFLCLGMITSEAVAYEDGASIYNGKAALSIFAFGEKLSESYDGAIRHSMYEYSGKAVEVKWMYRCEDFKNGNDWFAECYGVPMHRK